MESGHSTNPERATHYGFVESMFSGPFGGVVRALRYTRSVETEGRIPHSPWIPADVLWVAVFLLTGFVLSLVAWYQIADQASYDNQVGWADLAVGGLIIFTGAQFIWLYRGRRAVGEMRRRLLKLQVASANTGSLPFVSKAVTEDSGPAIFVSSPGSNLFHRNECIMVRGRTTSDRTRAEHLSSGLEPCGVCRP